jgi:hypothetical protein
LINDLVSTHRDISRWEEADIQVDNEWLDLALEKKVIEGTSDLFSWARLERVPTLELKGTHHTVIAINKDKKIKYRIVRGSTDPVVLMKKSA